MSDSLVFQIEQRFFVFVRELPVRTSLWSIIPREISASFHILRALQNSLIVEDILSSRHPSSHTKFTTGSRKKLIFDPKLILSNFYNRHNDTIWPFYLIKIIFHGFFPENSLTDQKLSFVFHWLTHATSESYIYLVIASLFSCVPA